MGKQHITETLVCGNCIHSSPAPGHINRIKICHKTGHYVDIYSTFCDYFVADWVLQARADLSEVNLGQLEKGIFENE